MKLALERIEFFDFDPPSEVAGHTENTWWAAPGGGYRLSLPDGESLLVESNLLDSWDIKLVTPHDASTNVGQAGSLAEAIEAADLFVSSKRPDAAWLVERFARWRTEPPTDKQRELLARNRIPAPEGLTRGQASQMISLVIASSRRA